MHHSMLVETLSSQKLADEMTKENVSQVLWNDWDEHVRLSICLWARLTNSG